MAVGRKLVGADLQHDRFRDTHGGEVEAVWLLRLSSGLRIYSLFDMSHLHLCWLTFWARPSPMAYRSVRYAEGLISNIRHQNIDLSNSRIIKSFDIGLRTAPLHT